MVSLGFSISFDFSISLDFSMVLPVVSMVLLVFSSSFDFSIVSPDFSMVLLDFSIGSIVLLLSYSIFPWFYSVFPWLHSIFHGFTRFFMVSIGISNHHILYIYIYTGHPQLGSDVWR